MNRLGKLLLGSVVENERFSPRLIANFLFVALFCYVVIKGMHTPGKVVGGIIITGHAPEYVINTLGIIIFGIFGLGKLPEIAKSFTKETVVKSEQTTIDTQGGPVTNTTESTLAGYDDGPGGLANRRTE